MTETPLFSNDWFDEAYRLTSTTQVPPPEPLRQLASEICRKFTIRGICDPMYICNTVAMELGIGNGCSEFKPVAKLKASATQVDAITKRLLGSYHVCIQDAEAQLRELIYASLKEGSAIA